MPTIPSMNPPPNPFWDFVADMQNHPFFAAYEAPQRPGQQARQGEPTTAAGPSNTTPTNKEQSNAEDPPEVDPATFRAQHREAHEGRRHERRGGCRRRSNSSDEEGERERHREHGARRGWGGRRGAWGGLGPHGFGEHGHPPHLPPGGPFLPGFPMRGFPAEPFWGQAEHQHRGPPGPHEHEHEHHGPPGWGGRGGPFRRGGPHPHFHGHPHGPHRGGPFGHGRRGPSPPPPGPPGFDLGRFLNELGERIGMDLSGAAFGHGRGGPSPPPPGSPGFDLGRFLKDLGERIGMDLSGAAPNLGLDRFMPGNSNAEVDFEPKADIFDHPTTYTVHVSLPGAKKSDVGVDWDGEHSALRVAGVVHRPDVDEEMLGRLVVDGRKRETGVFEKTIKLGTRREPAVVDVANIKAKMRDGVLVIHIPKIERGTDKREVPIAKSQSTSPVRREPEKDLLNDTDHAMTEKNEPEEEVQMIDRDEFEHTNTHKGKQAEHEAEKEQTRMSRDSSTTVEAQPERETEPLPVYHPTEHQEHQQEQEREHNDHSDWENFDSDEEGEFVKINVD